MSIIDLRFSTKSLQQLPHPTTGCQEYRDIHCPHLRALVYPNQITLAFRATINNQRIYETLGSFPLLGVEDARLHTMILLGNKKRLAIQSRRYTVEQAINDLWLPDMRLYKKAHSLSSQNSIAISAPSGDSVTCAILLPVKSKNSRLTCVQHYARQP